VQLGVTTEVALAGDQFTVNSKGLEEGIEGSPLRTLQDITTSTMPGTSSGMIHTLYVMRLATLNMKPGKDLFSNRMAPLPCTMRPGDLCPHLTMAWYRQQGIGLHPTMNLLLDSGKCEDCLQRS